MKVIHLNDECNVSFNLAAGFQEMGHAAEVWCEHRPDARLPLAAKLAYLPVRVAAFGRLNRRIRREAFDVVHIHNADRGWIGILGRHRYVLHCHGSDVRIGLTHALRRRWTIPALRRAHRVIVTTPDLLSWLRDIRPDAVFLPNPLRTDRFAPEARAGATRRVLLFSAFNNSLKGSDTAVAGLSRFHERHPDIEIHAFAMGDDLPRFRDLDWITMLPPVAADAVPKVLREYDVVVGQFSFGQLGVSELEAMACGKVVVCHVNDEFTAAYGEAPPVANAATPDAIASVLEHFMTDGAARASLGARAREWTIRHHDYRNVSARLAELYADAELGRGRPR
jgi:glycosyltransferase involved in cell wall biosynthesis